MAQSSKNCASCSVVGITNLNPINELTTATYSKKTKKFNCGNSQTFNEESAAKDYILGREFPKILALKNISKDNFRAGSCGVNKIPNLNLSQIPHIPDFNKYEEKMEDRGMLKAANPDHERITDTIKKELSERAVFDGIDKFCVKNQRNA